jgi:DNA primase
MRFPASFLDEIRARLPASAVVGRRVKLKKQGREFAGLSPFNAEKTASFFVNDTKGKWFDFSAGKNGDIFTFVMETEGLSFPEAVERLANEAGVPMPARDAEAEAHEKERATLYDVLELATQFFEASLNARTGATARGYLAGRVIGPDLQRAFRLGYAPADRSALKEHLSGKGISQEQMISAGLVVAGPDIPVSFDRFRERVIFPITDFRGRIVAFGGRALSADMPAKYLNSPETELFHKGMLLYNGASARHAVHDAGTVVVVEGYVDVIRMVAAGFTHTVAPLGTALTERQLDILWRMADEPILCFDGDKAGLRAAHRAADLALPQLKPGKSLRFALLPAGQDPDDLIRASGAEAMGAILSAARPLVDLVWGRETDAGVFDTPERRAALEARLADIARQIGDDSVRRHYQQAFAERVMAFFPAPEPAERGSRGGGRTSRYRSSDFRPPTPLRSRLIPVTDRLRRSQAVARPAADSGRERMLVIAMVNHPALLARHLDEFAHLELGSDDLGRLRGAVVDVVSHRELEDVAGLAKALADNGFAQLIAQLQAEIASNRHWWAAATADDRDAETSWLQALTLHRRKRTLHKELKEAEAALAVEPSDANLARLVDIQNQLANGEGTEALIEGFGASSGRQARVF